MAVKMTTLTSMAKEERVRYELDIEACDEHGEDVPVHPDHLRWLLTRADDAERLEAKFCAHHTQEDRDESDCPVCENEAHAMTAHDLVNVKDERDRLAAALREVTKREGAYSRDPLEHANNAIDNLVAIAEEALRGTSHE